MIVKDSNCTLQEIQCSKIQEGQVSLECDALCKEMKRKASEVMYLL